MTRFTHLTDILSLYFQQFIMLKFSSVLYLALLVSQCQFLPFNAMMPQWYARFQRCYDGIKNAQSPGLYSTLFHSHFRSLICCIYGREKENTGLQRDDHFIFFSFLLLYKAPVVRLIGSQSKQDGVCSTLDTQLLPDPHYQQRTGQTIPIVQVFVLNNLSPFQQCNVHPAIFFLCLHNFCFYFHFEG